VAIIADGQGTGSITSLTTTLPVLSVSNATTVEVIGSFAVFTVGLSAASATATTVTLALANGTATVGTDTGATAALQYSTNGGTSWTTGTSATIAAGQTSLLVRTAITDDRLEEGLENFSLTATRSAGSTANTLATGYGLISDDSASMASDYATSLITISDVVADEVTGYGVFTVNLSQAPTAAVSVNLTAVAGSAGASDFTAAAFQYSLNGGQTWITANAIPFNTTTSLTALVRVPITSDTTTEVPEQFFVNATSSDTTRAIVADGQAVVTIRDNDPGTTIALNTVGLTTSALSTTYGVLLEGINTTGSVTNAAPTFQVAGVGVTGSGTQGGAGGGGNQWIDNLESLVITFDRSHHPNGVQNLGFVVNSTSNLASTATNAVALTYTLYGIDGELLGQFSSVLETTVVSIPDTYVNVGKVVILANNSATATISSISYTDAALDTSAVAVAPEVIEYTLTSAHGATSTAMLTLNIMANELAGDSSDNTVTGTAANDYIAGLSGNDTLTGGSGHDIIDGGAGNDIISGNADNDTLSGGAGTDTLYGGTGNDVLRGGDGNDTLDGSTGNDQLEGGAGDDILTGDGADTVTGGADTLSGGAGNDTMTGGLLSDTFEWVLADAGARGTPAVDTITDFDVAAGPTGAVPAQGDVLDLRDLLSGENHAVATGNLSNFLHFELSGADTKVHISSTGAFGGGFSAALEDQTVILTGVDVYSIVGANATDQQIIQDLLTKGKLITD
jgi:Ca2+-binding RTX toxin-like protein